jgi:transcriptional regulator with XRE-family HTH domain
MDKGMESFGAALRRLRLGAGLSQPQLANLVPISQTSLSRYENEKQAVDPIVARRLDELLHADGELLAALPEMATDVLTSDDRARIRHGIAYPSRVDAATVTALADVLAAQRRLDDTLGPALILPATLEQHATVTEMLRHAEGPHRDELAAVVAQYTQVAGWLRAELRHDQEAVRLLADAEQLSDEIGSGELAAQAANFRGWLARQQGLPLAVVRWFLAAHHTPGAHPAQRVGDAAQAAQGYAMLGQRDDARRLLDVAGDLIDVAERELPPDTAYWLTPTFHRLNIGLAHLALDEPADAAEHLAAGLAGLPEEQAQAEWAGEYRAALERARGAA